MYKKKIGALHISFTIFGNKLDMCKKVRMTIFLFFYFPAKTFELKVRTFEQTQTEVQKPEIPGEILKGSPGVPMA